MSLEQSATFLTSSIMYGLGVVIWVGIVLAVNNLLAKHWKPVKMFKFLDYPSPRFIDEQKDLK